jgi:hypothetical protein
MHGASVDPSAVGEQVRLLLRSKNVSVQTTPGYVTRRIYLTVTVNFRSYRKSNEKCSRWSNSIGVACDMSWAKRDIQPSYKTLLRARQIAGQYRRPTCCVTATGSGSQR